MTHSYHLAAKDNSGKIESFENNRKFLDYMVSMRNKNIIPYLKDNKNEKDEKEMLKNLVNNINWIESYRKEISSIQLLFLKLNPIVKNLLDEIKKIIKEKQIVYEISSRNPEYTRIVNEVFFLSIESILRII